MMIVDDDAIERWSLHRFFDWSIVGVDVVGEAWNGQHALDIATDLKPDIVLADIRMPVMDGVEMGRRLKVMLPDVKIIFCSAHDEFEYARGAINLKAFGYILKPVRDDELLRMVKNAADRCIEERMQVNMLEKLKNRVSASMPLLKAGALHDLLVGHTDKIDEVLWDVGLEWLLGSTTQLGLILIRLVSSKTNPVDASQILEHLAFASVSHSAKLKLSVNEAAVLLRLDMQVHMLDEDMQAMCSKTESSIREHFGINACTAYAVRSGGISSIESMFEDAMQTINLRWSRVVLNEFRDSQTIRHFDLTAGSGSTVARSQFKDDLATAFRDGNVQLITDQIKMFFAHETHEKSTLPDLYEAGLYVLSSIVNTSRLRGYNPFRDINQEIASWTALLELKTLPDLETYLVNCATAIVQGQEAGSDHKVDFIISQVESIVTKHYSDSLTVEQIAKMLHFSPNYLGTLYKNKKGVGISEYITKFRVCKSMDLLRNHAYKVTDIARLCGYENIPYFHTIFRKHTGMTPNQYRRMIRAMPEGAEPVDAT